MRQVCWGALLAALLLTLGCSIINNPRPRPDGGVGRVPSRWNSQPDAATLVAYLNDNARLVQALRAEDVTLDARQGRQSGAVTGRLDCQKPRHFRLTGRVIGQPAVDLGSNEEEFWYWISQARPAYVFHCTHQALAEGRVRHMPFPFQPDMIFAALGMAEYDPHKPYDVRIHTNTIELIEPTRSPQGQPLQKVVVFSRAPARGDQPQVLAHILRDAQGHKIAEATITVAVRDKSTGAELPRRMQLVWPDEQVEMKMKFDDIRVVPPDPQMAQTLYSRRNLAQLPGFDLARGFPDEPVGHVERVSSPPR